MRMPRLACLAAALVWMLGGVAACTTGLDPESPLGPSEPRFGGMGYGSGNRLEGDTATATISSSESAGEVSAASSGMGYGSGN
jgi:hypothetical protein